MLAGPFWFSLSEMKRESMRYHLSAKPLVCDYSTWYGVVRRGTARPGVRCPGNGEIRRRVIALG